jgi:hypothetical protein
MIRTVGLTGFILFFGAVLNAGSVTYTYTGDDFSTYSGTYTSAAETNITVSLTFASALGPDFSEVQVTPQSFQISDGSLTLTDQSSNIGNAGTYFFVGTDGAGDISEWNINVDQTNGTGFLELLTEGDIDVSDDCGAGSIPDNTCFSVSSAVEEYSGYNVDFPAQPGWTIESSTPEPSIIVLAITGGLFVFIGRLRLRSALSR